jgi:uncharacterized protein (TIGR02147 family)
MGLRKVSIFNYTDHQQYLKDWFSDFADGNPKYSLQWLADKLGVASKGYMHRILNHPSKPISSKIMDRWSALIGHSASEDEFFRALVTLAHSSRTEDRMRCFQVMHRTMSARESGKIHADRFSYLSSWWLPALREIAASKPWGNDITKMGKCFAREISPSKVQKGIELMLRLGLLREGPKGTFHQTDAVLRTEPDIQELAVYHFHKEQLELASESLALPISEREFGGITFGLPKGEFHRLRKRLREFQDALLAEFGSMTQNPEEVYQINFQIFSLATVSRSKS